ncbi:MAG TPA: hypothetical protein VG273_26585 [Bryobacteraceae bacterium]|jgi:hypothetical protein|nr:hypothetical protein [Bryobacteraceae bacterium]
MVESVKRLAAGPLGYLSPRERVKRGTDFREKESWGLVSRPNYAYGMLRAADLAKFLGKSAVTACEFGVATGNGLVNMVELAAMIETETGIKFRVVGLDTGEGLPEVTDYRDHPELWSPGDFAMTNKNELRKRMGDRAELIFGDIKDTVDGFVASLSESAPLGFVAVDVDIYSGAKSAFRSLLGRAEIYTPAISVYCDDVSFFFANRWCGELLAIDEFNAENAMRKIDHDHSLPGIRPSTSDAWYKSMFVAHILDHEIRRKPQRRTGLSIQDHYAFMKAASLF